jgi:putative transposase
VGRYGGEGAKYWLHVLTELKNRGVADVLMLACDGLPGAAGGDRQHWAASAKALKPVYTAATEAAAKERFTEFAEVWGGRYPAIVRLWDNTWAEFVPFLALDRGDEPGPTGTGRKRWTARWKPALNAFEIAFDGRLATGRK